MRIYLKTTKHSVVHPDGQRVSYAMPGFYANVPDAVAGAWLEEGVAFNATPDNKVLTYAGLEEVTIDLDAGDQLLAEHTPFPKAPPLPVEPLWAEPPDDLPNEDVDPEDTFSDGEE